MAVVRADRVLELSSTSGTGPFGLGGPVTGYRSFGSVMNLNDTCYYAAQSIDVYGVPTGEWEVGVGTYSGTNQLSRTTVLSSSNTGSLVNFGADTKQVYITPTATELIAVFASISPYTHTQNVASDAWTINHNLGAKPVVAILNAGGNEVEAHLVHTSNNQVIAYFSTPITGIARCAIH